LDTTAAADSETPASPGKASRPQASLPIKNSVAAPIWSHSTTNLDTGSLLKEKTVQPQSKPASGIARSQPEKARPEQPEQSVVSKAPVMFGYQVVAKKRSEHGSLWPKALSLAAMTSILAFVLVESFSLQRPVGGQARAASLTASVQGDSTAGNSVHPEASPSAIDAPFPSPKGPPVGSRGPRNLGSDGSQDVITREFPRDSNVGPEPSSDTQELTGIFFDEDSAVIGWQSRPSLQQIADALAVNPKADAVLEGHTDSSGPEAYNLDLSNRRAIAVRDVLVNEFHVSSTRLTVIGSGSAAPIRPNSTAAGRAYNRRVEVRLAVVNE
jgi:outer membrane protein OmpA-like peptidoglycan-associated protein